MEEPKHWRSKRLESAKREIGYVAAFFLGGALTASAIGENNPLVVPLTIGTIGSLWWAYKIGQTAQDIERLQADINAETNQEMRIHQEKRREELINRPMWRLFFS